MGTYVHPWLCSTVALVACLNAAVAQEAVPAVAPTAVSEAAPRTRPATLLPGLRIDLRRRVVEADARVVFDPQRAKAGPTPPDSLVPRAGGWLELVACTPGMREYESLVAVACRPRHLHQALLMVGLKPGKPRRVHQGEAMPRVEPARGTPVEVTVRVEGDGLVREEPVGRWVLDRWTGASLESSRWLFTGSTLHRVEGREIYLADLNGTVVSLVNFGDDVVCRATPLTDRDDGQAFAANVALIPPLGTAVKLRFRAAPPRSTTRPGPSSRPSSAMRSGRPIRPPHETSPSAPE